MTSTELVRFPASPITPQGARYFLQGIHPRIRLRSPDETVVFDLMGGASIPDWAGSPECVQLSEAPKGLIAPWKMIDQQGSNEDGTTFLDSVGEPAEIELPLIAHARDGVRLREVIRTLFASLDSKQTATLSWFTPDIGMWWATVRWFRNPREAIAISGDDRTAEITLALRIDHGFWRSFDHVDEFRFAYEAMTDTFDEDLTEERRLNDNWAVFNDGPGGGYVYQGRGKAQWRDDPDRLFFTEGKTFVATHKTFETETDDMVTVVVLDTMQEFGSRFDMWGRCGRRSDGSWNGYGVRARVGGSVVQLHAFNNFHATHIRTWTNIVPALFGEKWWLECGGLNTKGEYDPRVFRVKRGGGTGATALYTRDEAAVSPLGAAFRVPGFGGYAAGALFTQGTPPDIRKISAGDATATEQSGHLKFFNIGDQPAPPEYTCYGPGIFKIASGPGSTDYVEFGPLLPNQVVQLRTDNRKRAIVDLTRVPPTAAELLEYREAMKGLESFAAIANLAPTVDAQASMFDVVPPQGNLHTLLKGRFARPIPQKSPGRKPEPHLIAVSISGGNADSRIVGALTPLRRYPQ